MNKKTILLFFIFLIMMLTPVYADELVCSEESCKKKITIKNSNTAVFPDANNKFNSFITVCS